MSTVAQINEMVKKAGFDGPPATWDELIKITAGGLPSRRGRAQTLSTYCCGDPAG